MIIIVNVVDGTALPRRGRCHRYAVALVADPTAGELSEYSRQSP